MKAEKKEKTRMMDEMRYNAARKNTRKKGDGRRGNRNASSKHIRFSMIGLYDRRFNSRDVMPKIFQRFASKDNRHGHVFPSYAIISMDLAAKFTILSSQDEESLFDDTEIS